MKQLHICILLFQSIMAIVFSLQIQYGRPNKYTYYGLLTCIVFVILEIIYLDSLTNHSDNQSNKYLGEPRLARYSCVNKKLLVITMSNNLTPYELHQDRRKLCWLHAAATIGGAATCREVATATNWADRILADFDRKFPAPPVTKPQPHNHNTIKES